MRKVSFRETVGFRVMDERDLREYWPTYSEPTGWLYDVEEGGWMELELKRSLFNPPEVIPGIKEWLFVDEQCVNVFRSISQASAVLMPTQ